MDKAKKKYRNNLLLASVAIFVLGLAVLFLSMISNHKAERNLASLDSLPLEEKFTKAIDVKNFSDHSKLNIYLGKLGSSVCEEYKAVTIEFEAQDVAVSGDRPKMLLKLDCTKITTEDGRLLVKLPNQIKSQRRPSSVSKDDIGDGIELSFEGALWVWPTTWSISSVNYDSSYQDIHKSDLSNSPWLADKIVQW